MTHRQEFGRFFLPGPTEVRPEVLAAMTKPMIAHRGADFEALFARLQVGLGSIFRTARPVYIATCSGTGLMEGAIRNAPPGRMLCLVNGAFARRFAHIARACGREVDVLDVPWGRAVDPAMVEERLSRTSYAALTVTHSETSTGALTDVRAIAELATRAGVLALVDSVSGVGGARLLTDEWGLDFVFTSSQKAIAVPPGLAFVVVSPRYLELAGKVTDRGTYFDVVEFDRFAAKRQTPNTPAVSLLYALDVQLERLVAEGPEARWARHESMALRCAAWAAETADTYPGLGILAPHGERSPTVTAFTLPEGVSGTFLAGAMAEAGCTIASGYGDLKESTVRVGHMGEHTVEEVDRCLEALGRVLGKPGLR